MRRQEKLNKDVKYIYDSRGFGTLFIDRADKKNAISSRVAEDLNNLIDQISVDEINFLVLNSADSNVFCAGGDLNELHGELTEDEAYEDLKPMKEFLFKLATFPLPTIALLHGIALGGGCELATACDFRIAKEDTRFGFVQANLGILPGWGGGALLYEKVAPTFAYKWLIDAAMYSATYLEENNWLHRIVPKDEWDEDRLIETYLTRSHGQMLHLKSQYLEKIDQAKIYKNMDLESQRSASLWESEEHIAAVATFLNK